MRYRSVVLFLATSFALAPFAHAGNAIVADEFEQRRNVEACDAYGAGFARLPGTDTCVRVGGKIRYEKSVSKQSDSGGD